MNLSDQLEIRWDIGHEAKERAAELGMRLERQLEVVKA